jgi:hypothetical protein
MAKQRPGQKATKTANDSKTRLQQAQDMYDEVDKTAPGAADLKSLINSVKVLSEKQSQQQQRLTKKQLQDLKTTLDKEQIADLRREKLIQAEAEVAAEEAEEKEAEDEERKKALVVKTADLKVAKKDKDKKKKKQADTSKFTLLLKDLRDAMDRKRAEPLTVNGKDISRMKSALLAVYQAYQKLKSGVNDPTGSKLAAADKHGNIDVLLQAYKKEIDALDLIAQRNDKQLAAIQARDGDKKELGYQDLYQSKFGKFLNLGRDDQGHASLSRSMMKAASMFGRNLSNKASALAPSNLYNSGVSWAIQKAGNNPRAVSAILKVDKTLRYIGNEIKTVGVESYQWLHKSMGDIFGYLRRKWTQLSSGGGMGALGKLVGLGALFTALIGPLLSGINTELEKRYGKDYIQSFIKTLWEGAKTWLVESLKNFFVGPKGVATPTAKQVETAKQVHEAARAVNSGQVAGALWKGNMLSKAYRALRYGADSDEALAGYVDEYMDPKTDPKLRDFDKKQIDDMLARRKGKSVPSNLLVKLQAGGFNVGGVTAQPVQAPFRSNAVNTLAQPTGAASGAPVSAASPAVTATPAPKVTPGPAGGKSGSGSGGTAPGLGNAQIMNKATDDAFHFINGGALIVP